MHALSVNLPSYRTVPAGQAAGHHSKSYTVYRVDVLLAGRYSHSVEKRYSDFEELHKRLRKRAGLAHRAEPHPTEPLELQLPAKKVLKWNARVLEARRDRLEQYLRALSLEVLRRAAVGQQPSGPALLCAFLGLGAASSSSLVVAAVGSGLGSDTATGSADDDQRAMNSFTPVFSVAEVETQAARPGDSEQLDLITGAVLDTMYSSGSAGSSGDMD